MRAITKGVLLRSLIGLGAAVVTAAALHLLLAPEEGGIYVDWQDRTIDFLSPAWFYLVALVPYFFVVRTQSLTDVSLAQQYIATGVRSLLVIGLALALARPVWSTTDDKVATVVLVDVSDSITDKQLAASRTYVDGFDRARRDQDRLYVVSFAERPRVVRRDDGGQIQRHKGEGAGTNVQAAMQLAYGLYPDGYLPRMVIVSDGNQTGGDLLVESYRASDLGVRVSWKTFPPERRPEVRVLSLSLPDEIKVGQPFEVKAELWSTARPGSDPGAARRTSSPTAASRARRSSSRPAGAPGSRSPARPSGPATPPTGCAWSSRSATPSRPTTPRSWRRRSRAARACCTSRAACCATPSVASHLERALEHENIDVEVRGPRGLPASPKELEKFDLVLVSDVPAHFVGLAQMAALESYVRDLGGGLIMAGGEDSFGSGGYQGTRIEKIMPVRFDSEKQREQPHIALVLVMDRSGSMSGPKLDAAKESARATVEVLSPSDLIGVVVFDNTPTTLVRLQRASNRMRISTDISRLVAGGGTHIFPALQEAYQILQSANAKVKHVILLSDGQAPYDGIAELCQEMRASRITVSAVGIGDADRNLLQQITDNGEGRLYMTEDLSAPAAHLHEGDHRGAEGGAGRGPHPRAGGQERGDDRGDRRGHRAAPARLRHHQAEADRRGGAGRRAHRRPDPGPLAARHRHLGGVDQRRQEPLEHRVDPVGRLSQVLGPGGAHQHAAQGLRQLRPVRPGARRPRPGGRRRGRRERQVRQRARHHARDRRPGQQQDPALAADGAERGRALHRRLRRRPLRQLPAQGGAQARRQGRGRERSAQPPCPTRSSSSTPSRTTRRCATPLRSPAAWPSLSRPRSSTRPTSPSSTPRTCGPGSS